MILAAIFGTYLYADFRNATGSCTQLIPASASVSFFANSTISGTAVSYGNGTNSFFRAGTCPQPVHQNLYNAISVISQDPRFVRDENGSQFTVDPVNSMANPINLGNGSFVEELIFNHLNLSQPIFPCNLSLIYSKPIAQIYVFFPVTSNGSNVYGNDTIAAFPGNQLHFNCPTESGVSILSKSQVTQPFTVGGFSFKLISSSMNFVGANGTSYPGYDYAFNVTYFAAPPQNTTQQVVFSWPSENALAANQLPNSSIMTPFNEYVVMRWFTNSTGLFVVVTTLA